MFEGHVVPYMRTGNYSFSFLEFTLQFSENIPRSRCDPNKGEQRDREICSQN